MFARVTAYRMNPDSEDEVVAMLDDIRAQAAKIDGLISSYDMWNDVRLGYAVLPHPATPARRGFGRWPGVGRSTHARRAWRSG